MYKYISTLILLFSTAMFVVAQDLSLQRGEKQDYGVLLGEKLNHDGLVINPTPHELVRLDGECNLTGGVVLEGQASEYKHELDFFTIHTEGIPLCISYGDDVATLNGVKPLSGAYILQVSSAAIDIKAYDDAGVFYAIQSLRQIVACGNAQDFSLPCLLVSDWPDLPYRGVVEGFYGTPWSHEKRMSLIAFYGRHKMNYYIYGPKDDPYHSSPHWRQPYPSDEAENIRQLVEACRYNRVNFVWAIHPGQDIRWDEDDYNNLLHKFESMYSLGVRAFAIHFDDISGEGANPYYQIALLNRLTEEFVAIKGDVAPLIVCPTDYTRLWANPTPRGSLVKYGETLHPSVDIFWTGDVVCSDLTEETVAWVSERVQRPILFWWNYPVTDYARHIMLQAPVYGLALSMTADKVRGIVSNPMEHAEASKLALYSVADYAWNTLAYNPVDSWERALESLAPDVKEAYRLFAIHSCDTETGYRRIESWETQTFTMDTYAYQLAQQLKEECRAIESVPVQMQACSNKSLLNELNPWLWEFGKLGERCRRAIEILELYNDARYQQFWSAYVDNLMTPQETESYEAHKSGTMKLQPFYETLMDDMAACFYEHLSGNKAAVSKAYGTYITLQSSQVKFMFDNDTTTYYHSGNGQRDGHYVAVDMGFVQEIKKVNILQGRNSVDDVDYYDNAIVEYSVDANEWYAMTDTLCGVYNIAWQGDGVTARYVRLRKLSSPKTNWLAIRSFDVNPVEKSSYHIDANPYTALHSVETVTVDVPQSATQCVVLMGTIDCAQQPICQLFAHDGTLLNTLDITEPMMELDVNDVETIQLSGVGAIYEIVWR